MSSKATSELLSAAAVLADSTNNFVPVENRIRSLEIVDGLLEKAKINPTDLCPIVQNIYLTNTIACEEYKLLEIDQQKLDYLLEGNKLIIRGDGNESAVCCTQTSTHAFKVSEISNPLLVCAGLKFPTELLLQTTDENGDGGGGEDSIDGDQQQLQQKRSGINSQVVFMANSFYILEKERPRMHKLKNLLELNLYMGQVAEENNDAHKYTIRDFLDIIQSSEEEIYSYLRYIDAYKIDGNWRLLDPKFYTTLFDSVLKLIDEKSWQPDRIPVDEIYDELKNYYGLSILNQFVNYYFSPTSDDPQMFSLNIDRVFHFYAEALLRKASKMRFSEFQLIIRQIMPSSFNFEFDLLKIQDICYVEEPHIYYLNVLDLPDDLEKRFKFLFERRKRWNFDELKSLIQDLCGFDMNEINNALLKYCRSFTQNNVKYFSSRV